MKIGLLADAHGNAGGLRAALASLDGHGCDVILFAGDAVGYYPDENEVIALLAERTIAVRGNHDRLLVAPTEAEHRLWPHYALDDANGRINTFSRDWLEALPLTRRFQFGTTDVLLCHGSPSRDDEYLYPDYALVNTVDVDADIIVAGHTHVPMDCQIGKVRIINPGSCGQPRDYLPGACAAVLDLVSGETHFFRASYDIARYVARLQKLSVPPAFSQILLRTRDSTPKAR